MKEKLRTERPNLNVEELLFKKCHNISGKFYLYMNQREYVQCEGSLEQVHGVLFSEVFRIVIGEIGSS